MKIKDPFFGEIEIEKIGETSMHAVGESIVRTVYIDKQGHYYIDVWATTGNGDPLPMTIIHKDVIKIINEHENRK